MPTSASTTPTSVTFGKSNPLAIICVPSRHVHFAAADAVEDLGVRPFAARRVHVHARDVRRRKPVGQQPLDLLCAEPALPHHRARTARTGARQLLGVPAIVTDEPFRRSMIGEADRAVGARRDEPARLALHERRVASAIQQQDALLFLREPVRQRVLEVFAQHETQPIGRVALGGGTHGGRARGIAAIDDVARPAVVRRRRARVT